MSHPPIDSSAALSAALAAQTVALQADHTANTAAIIADNAAQSVAMAAGLVTAARFTALATINEAAQNIQAGEIEYTVLDNSAGGRAYECHVRVSLTQAALPDGVYRIRFIANDGANDWEESYTEFTKHATAGIRVARSSGIFTLRDGWTLKVALFTTLPTANAVAVNIVLMGR